MMTMIRTMMAMRMMTMIVCENPISLEIFEGGSILKKLIPIILITTAMMVIMTMPMTAMVTD